MKYKLLLINVLILISCAKKTKVSDQNPRLSRSGGQLFLNQKAFSGILTESYPDGSLKSRTPYRSGRENGRAEGFYENGNRRFVRFYRAGKKHGRHFGFHPDGSREFEFFFRAGQHHGPARRWYADDRPYTEFYYENGEEIGTQKMWEPGGEIRANYVVKNGRRYGLTGYKNCRSLNENEEGNIN